MQFYFKTENMASDTFAKEQEQKMDLPTVESVN